MLIDAQIKKLAIRTAAIFLLVVAALLGAQQMYLMAVVVAVVPGVSWLMGFLFSKGIECDRQMPATCHVHERIRVRVTVRNTTFFPRFFLRISDRMPRWLRFAGSDTPQGPLILSLWPGDAEDVTYYIEPLKRGQYHVGPMRLLSSDPLGFSTFRKTLNDQADIIVYPEVLPMRPEFLDAGGGHGWQDQDSAQSRGSGTDFDGVREYRPGDELRRVNWKSTARTGVLAVTEYSQGYANSILVALDTSKDAYADSGAGLESALEYGVTLAASIVGAGLRFGSPTSLITCDDLATATTPMRGIEHLPTALDMLARCEPTSDIPFATVVEQAMRLVRPGTILVAITPESSDNPQLRTVLDQWMRSPASSSICLFWLEKTAFHDLHQKKMRELLARKRKPADVAADTPEVKTRVVSTRYGREFHIAPDGELVRVLQGTTYV
ncbi:MAG TPA: DUF58 domain-containing protein [Capsulimonadaceae bacterium]|jgi:uncharacterized protein (DUF58 family)